MGNRVGSPITRTAVLALVVVLASGLLVAPARAQNLSSSSIDGTVTDESGGALESVLVCHRGIDDALGRRLTSALVDALQELARAGRWNLVPLQELPAAPIPLHPGAAVYYRESELLR